MENALTKMVEVAPWAAALLIQTWLLLNAAMKERAERVANAKEKSEADRAHSLEVNKMWMESIKNVFDKQEASTDRIVEAIQIMHEDLNRQYESMGITKDLYDELKIALLRGKRP